MISDRLGFFRILAASLGPRKISFVIASVLLLFGCAGKLMRYDNEAALSKIDDYDRVLKVKELVPEATPTPPLNSTITQGTDNGTPAPTGLMPQPTPRSGKVLGQPNIKVDPVKIGTGNKIGTGIKTGTGVKTGVVSAGVKTAGTTKTGNAKAGKSSPDKNTPDNITPPVVKAHEPELEDAEGFIGRRPMVDPFRPGEKVTLKLTYFGIKAGEMTLEVKPHVEVNGRKAYHFHYTMKSNSSFSSFYSVDDSGETFLDYELMRPYNYALHVRESKQIREVRSYLDWDTMKAKLWERKVTQEHGVENKDKSWDILPFSQNVFSATYYFRTFALKLGKVINFRVVDEEKNLVLKAEVIRKEKLETELGVLDTLVLRPEIAIEGVFKPMGEVYFWVTDDDRKFLVQIEAKIKIGKVMGYVTSIEKGQP